MVDTPVPGRNLSNVTTQTTQSITSATQAVLYFVIWKAFRVPPVGPPDRGQNDEALQEPTNNRQCTFQFQSFANSASTNHADQVIAHQYVSIIRSAQSLQSKWYKLERPVAGPWLHIQATQRQGNASHLIKKTEDGSHIRIPVKGVAQRTQKSVRCPLH